MIFRFTDRLRFPKDAEIGTSAAFIEVDPMDSMDIVCPASDRLDSAAKHEHLIIHQVRLFYLSVPSFGKC